MAWSISDYARRNRIAMVVDNRYLEVRGDIFRVVDSDGHDVRHTGPKIFRSNLVGMRLDGSAESVFHIVVGMFDVAGRRGEDPQAALRGVLRTARRIASRACPIRCAAGGKMWIDRQMIAADAEDIALRAGDA